MVDVSAKPDTARAATARGHIAMSAEALRLALSSAGPKGAVEGVAEIAGVMAAKCTADLIPLCHPFSLSGVEVTVAPAPDGLPKGLQVRAAAYLESGSGLPEIGFRLDVRPCQPVGGHHRHRHRRARKAYVAPPGGDDDVAATRGIHAFGAEFVEVRVHARTCEMDWSRNHLREP